jgi:4'-phosphopantetheinyl transferase
MQPQERAALEPLLSDEERERAARFVVEPPRLQFIVARGVLRQLLERYLGMPARHFDFAFGDFGKPRLAVPANSDLRFNVSHSGELVLLAFSWSREVGVDVERLHTVQAREEIAERFFALPEAGRIRQLPLEDRDHAFFHHWVRKEAFVKAVGKGIASGLSQEVEVLTRADEPAPAPRTASEPQESVAWKLLSFDPEPGYLGAVSAAGEDWMPEFWKWEP